MDDRALAYLISLGIIGAGFGWIAIAHSALIIALSVLTIAVGVISLLTELRIRMY